MSRCVVYDEGSQSVPGVASGSLEGEHVPVGRAWETLTSVDKGRVRLAKEVEKLP